MSGALLRRRDRTARALPVQHFSAAVNTQRIGIMKTDDVSETVREYREETIEAIVEDAIPEGAYGRAPQLWRRNHNPLPWWVSSHTAHIEHRTAVMHACSPVAGRIPWLQRVRQPSTWDEPPDTNRASETTVS